MGSRCVNCATLFVPPRALCIHCQGTDLKWVELKGTGKLVAFTCIFIAPPAMREQGYDRDHPYCAGVVELDEHPRVVARIAGVNALEPETIKIGLRLQVDFVPGGVGQAVTPSLVFKSVGATSLSR